MNIPMQTIYLLSASIALLAMVFQIRRLIHVKQSDGFSLTTWAVWVCCQSISFLYASSIGAYAYMYVNAACIVLYSIMVVLIIKYRKRRSLIDTLVYWKNRGYEEKQHISFSMKGIRTSLKAK